MKKINLITLTCFSILLLSTSSRGANATQVWGKQVTPDPEAVAAGNRFFAAFDTGNYKTAYQMMAARVQRGGPGPEERWIDWARARRAPLGRAVSRGITQARFGNTLPGTPDGNYEIIVYKTRFERKAQSTEAVTLTKESGHWQVSGYHFN